MNIDKPSGPLFIQAYQKQNQVSKLEKVKRVQNDQLEISNQAKELFEQTKDIDKTRQEKINTLKAQIQSGDYKVNSENVANKVFEFWFDK